MTSINLLPWREEQQEERKREFFTLLGLSVTLAGVMLFGAHFVMSSRIGNEEANNRFLTNEIAALDQKIAEINELKQKKERLTARMQIIQDLQVKRPHVVRVFDQITRLVPQGLYLTRFKRHGNVLLLDGMAESSTRVSTFMRNLEKSTVFRNPTLSFITADNASDGRISRFTLQVQENFANPPLAAPEVEEAS